MRDGRTTFHRRIAFHRQLLLGLVLGALLLTAFPRRAEAQILTFDKPSWLLKLEDMAREVQRFEQTVQHYVQMYQLAVQHLSRLTNILSTADELLARNKQLFATISGVGGLIRQAFQLKRQFENMVHSSIISIERLGSRLRNGILNPDQDMADLEEYLKDSIGRSADDTVFNMQRMARLDNEFERMRYELQQAYIRLAHAEHSLAQFWPMLDAEMAKPEHERYGVETIKNAIMQWQQIIEQLHKQIEDLTAQIAERAKKYGMVIDQRANFGQTIDNTDQAFTSITTGKKQILKELDQEFDPDEGIVDDNEWF